MVFFIDLDGTLVDSLPLLYDIYCQFLARYGVKGTPEEFAQINGPSLKEGIAFLKEKHSLPDEVHSLFMESMQAIGERYRHEVQLFDGAAEFLEEVKSQGGKIALVTSADGASAKAILERCGIASAFDALISSDGLLKAKPDPAIYNKALEIMNAQPGDAFAIEDAPNGVLAAQRAELPVIWMTHRPSTEKVGDILAQVHSWDEARNLLPTILGK